MCMHVVYVVVVVGFSCLSCENKWNSPSRWAINEWEHNVYTEFAVAVHFGKYNFNVSRWSVWLLCRRSRAWFVSVQWSLIWYFLNFSTSSRRTFSNRFALAAFLSKTQSNCVCCLNKEFEIINGGKSINVLSFRFFRFPCVLHDF